MPTKRTHKDRANITPDQVQEMRDRYLKGESYQQIGKSFDISGSTANYHIQKNGHIAKKRKGGGYFSGKGRAWNADVKVKRTYNKKPKYIEMPVADMGSDRVAIVITNKGSLNSVLEGLWK